MIPTIGLFTTFKFKIYNKIIYLAASGYLFDIMKFSSKRLVITYSGTEVTDILY